MTSEVIIGIRLRYDILVSRTNETLVRYEVLIPITNQFIFVFVLAHEQAISVSWTDSLSCVSSLDDVLPQENGLCKV